MARSAGAVPGLLSAHYVAPGCCTSPVIGRLLTDLTTVPIDASWQIRRRPHCLLAKLSDAISRNCATGLQCVSHACARPAVGGTPNTQTTVVPNDRRPGGDAADAHAGTLPAWRGLRRRQQPSRPLEQPVSRGPDECGVPEPSSSTRRCEQRRRPRTRELALGRRDDWAPPAP